MLKTIKNIASYIRNRAAYEPQVGIILGTGLGGLVERMAVHATIDYADIKGFPRSTVEGHAGRLIFGELGGKRVVAMQGRFHYYEGYAPEQVVMPVRVMRELGISTLVVSNAAGGLNPDFQQGDVMLITDHINLIPNPLIGPNDAALGVRFPDMSEAYDRGLIATALSVGCAAGIALRQGCYVGLTGPSFETPAECRYLRGIGADAVGMSTTPEVIAARHVGLPVLGVSVITNVAFSGEKASHTEVLEAGRQAQEKMSRLVEGVLQRI